MIYVKQYGAKRSGTNYTRWLLQENFEVTVLSEVLGWKHGPHPERVDWTGKNWTDSAHREKRRQLLALVTDDLRKAVADRQVRYVITAKNPYAWYDSYMRFVDAGTTQKGAGRMSPEEAADAWNAIHMNWQALAESNALAKLVRYEDLLADLDGTLDALAERLQLPRKPGAYKDTSLCMARRSDLSWGMGPTDMLFDRTRYTEATYLSRFDDHLKGLFRKKLSAKLMKALEYEIL